MQAWKFPDEISKVNLQKAFQALYSRFNDIFMFYSQHENL